MSRVLTLALLVGFAPAAAAQAPAAITRLEVMLDSATTADVAGSPLLTPLFIPATEALTFCGRTTCLVLRAPGPVGTVTVGTLRVSVAPPEIAAADVALAPRPPEPSWDVPADSLPLVLDLLSASLAVSTARIAALDTTFRALGASVTREGEGIVVDLEGVRLRIRPAYRGAGVERLEFVLRRPAVGNPSYHFGARSVLRFGPGRRAHWTF
jgi:hypothetical protein